MLSPACPEYQRQVVRVYTESIKKEKRRKVVREGPK